LAVAGSTTGAVVGGITVVAKGANPADGAGVAGYSCPTSITREASAVSCHAGVARSMLASARLVAAGTVLGRIAVVAVYSCPASLADAACSGKPTVADSMPAGAPSTVSAVACGIAGVAIISGPARVAGEAVAASS